MTRLIVRILGPFQAYLDGIPVTRFESDKVRAILAYLMVEMAEVNRRDKLAGLLWAEMPETRARSNLSQALYCLGQMLSGSSDGPPFLLRSRDSIQFNPHCDYWLDVASFTQLLEASAQHNHQSSELCSQCLLNLSQAVELYRGDFLEGLSFRPDLGFEQWCLARRAHINRLALDALSSLTAYHVQHGEVRTALAYAWRQVELDPLNEAGQRQLMRLLEATNQRNQALNQFRRFELLLAEELEISPEPETIELYARLRGESASISLTQIPRHNLPAPLTPFIGRQAELKELQVCLQDPYCRLLTIFGPGGSGKTRLALEIARMSLAAFKHGVYFVETHALQNNQSILPAVVAALAYPLQETGDPQQQLSNYIRDKNLLLVMDGFEHLLDSAPWLSEILHVAPQLKLLVTSRERLNIKGEHLYPLLGLRYPQQVFRDDTGLASDAVQLFLDGARRIKPGFDPLPGDLEHILQVCRLVQGMPLGLLLAASWVPSMEIAEIAAEIERSLDFLSSEWTDVPARQRSLRATFDHSWNLLNSRQQGLIKIMSVFRGGFSRAAALAIASASPHDLRSLVDKSLLTRKSASRYEIHALLRQYSAEKQAALAEDDLTIHERHALYFCEALAAWGQRLKSPRQETALQEMDSELENLHAAWVWVVRQRISPLLAHMLEPLCQYYDLRLRYPEGESACRVALEGLDGLSLSQQERRIQVQLTLWQSRFNRLLGKHELAQRQREACQVLLEATQQAALDTRFEQALLSYELGDSIRESDFVTARGHYQHSQALFQQAGQPWWAAITRLNSVICHVQVGDFEAANSGFASCLADLPVHGDRKSLAKALRWKGFLHVRRGELSEGMQSMQAAVAVYRAIGDRANIADGLSGLGLILSWQGQFANGIDQLNQSLAIYQELGDRYHTAFVILVVGLDLVSLGRYPQAVERANTSLAQAVENGFLRVAAGSRMILGWVALSAGDPQRGRAALQASVAEYRQAGQLDELGWALAALGQADLALGETQAGLGCMREALQTGAQIRAALTICHAIGPSAAWIGRQGNPLRALELYSLARQNPATGNSCWFEEIYGRQVAALAGHLPAEAVAAAQERGRALDLWETARQLLAELG